MPFDEDNWLERASACSDEYGSTDPKQAIALLKEWFEADQEYYDAFDQRQLAAHEYGMIEEADYDVVGYRIQLLSKLQKQYKKEGDGALEGTIYGMGKAEWWFEWVAYFVGGINDAEKAGYLPRVHSQNSGGREESKKDGKKEGKKDGKKDKNEREDDAGQGGSPGAAGGGAWGGGYGFGCRGGLGGGNDRDGGGGRHFGDFRGNDRDGGGGEHFGEYDGFGFRGGLGGGNDRDGGGGGHFGEYDRDGGGGRHFGEYDRDGGGGGHFGEYDRDADGGGYREQWSGIGPF
jgi:hypothetical protein